MQPVVLHSWTRWVQHLKLRRSPKMGKKQERRIISGSPGQTRRSTAPTDKQNVTISISELLEDRTESARFSEVILTEPEYRDKEPESQAVAGEENSEFMTDSPKSWGYKNVFGLSVSYLIIFSVFLGLQNLQSSINSTGGLGLASLAVLYACFVVAGFVTPTIVKVLGTKYSLLFGFIGHLVYTLTNYYPSWYTLIPSSALVGFASAPLWAAANTHITKVAVEIAPARKDLALVISTFTGIFFFFFQLAQLPGNLASSLILFPYSNEDTLDNTSALVIVVERNASPATPAPPSNELCKYLNETTTISTKYLYALVSVYAASIVVGIIILIFVVDRLPSDNQFFSVEKKFHLYLKKPLIELLRLLKDWRMVLITPMAIFSGMEMAFAFGSFTEIYISECFGMYQVGFTLSAFGLSSAFVSIAYGRVIKFIPRFTIVLLGATVNVTFLVFLFVWERVPSYGVIFTFAIGWGAADTIWHNVLCSLTGILFIDKSETAYSAIRIWQALGFTVGFVSAELLPLEGRLSLLLVTVAFTTLFNFVVEFRTQTKEHLLPWVYRSTECDSKTERTPSQIEIPSQNEIPSPSSHTNALFAAYGGRRPSTFSNEGIPPSPRLSVSSTHNKIMDLHIRSGSGPMNESALAVVLEDVNENDYSLHESELPQRKYSIHRSPSYLIALNSSSVYL